MTCVRSSPCQSCPYRRDVPPGVWAASEYDKLRRYDQDTAYQPAAAFSCHATPEQLCHGWAVVGDRQPHSKALLALRLNPAEIPPATVPLWSSGTEAADHGQSAIHDPPAEATAVARRLLRKYPRLSDADR